METAAASGARVRWFPFAPMGIRAALPMIVLPLGGGSVVDRVQQQRDAIAGAGGEPRMTLT